MVKRCGHARNGREAVWVCEFVLLGKCTWPRGQHPLDCHGRACGRGCVRQGILSNYGKRAYACSETNEPTVTQACASMLILVNTQSTTAQAFFLPQEPAQEHKTHRLSACRTGLGPRWFLWYSKRTLTTRPVTHRYCAHLGTQPAKPSRSCLCRGQPEALHTLNPFLKAPRWSRISLCSPKCISRCRYLHACVCKSVYGLWATV